MKTKQAYVYFIYVLFVDACLRINCLTDTV